MPSSQWWWWARNFNPRSELLTWFGNHWNQFKSEHRSPETTRVNCLKSHRNPYLDLNYKFLSADLLPLTANTIQCNRWRVPQKTCPLSGKGRTRGWGGLVHTPDQWDKLFGKRFIFKIQLIRILSQFLEHIQQSPSKVKTLLTSASRASLGFLGLKGPCFLACSTWKRKQLKENKLFWALKSDQGFVAEDRLKLVAGDCYHKHSKENLCATWLIFWVVWSQERYVRKCRITDSIMRRTEWRIRDCFNRISWAKKKIELMKKITMALCVDGGVPTSSSWSSISSAYHTFEQSLQSVYQLQATKEMA